MKRYLKAIMLALLCVLTFTIAGCSENQPTVPNTDGNNTTENDNNQSGSGNTDQGNENKPVKKSLYETAKEVGFEGTSEEWNKRVSELMVSYVQDIQYQDGVYAAKGEVPPTDDMDLNINHYFDVKNNITYLRENGPAWTDHVDLGPTDKVELGDVDAAYILFNDNTIRLATLYLLSNGYALSTVEDIKVEDVKLNTNKISIRDDEFNTKLKIVITLSNNKEFEVPMTSPFVESNGVRPEVGTYEVKVKLNNKDYFFNVTVNDEKVIKISYIEMNHNEPILVIDKGNGNYDYKLKERNIIIHYTGISFTEQEVINKSMIKHGTLTRGRNHCSIVYNEKEFYTEIFLATEDDLKNATNVYSLNTYEDFCDSFSQDLKEQYCELNKEFISENHLKLSMVIHGTRIYVCDQITSENLVGFDNTKEGRGLYSLTYYGHNVDFYIPVNVQSVSNISYVELHPITSLFTNKEDIIFKIVCDQNGKSLNYFKRLIDYTKDDIVTDKIGLYFYDVNVNGNVYNLRNTVSNDYNTIDYIDNFEETVNINYIDENTIQFFDISSYIINRIDGYNSAYVKEISYKDANVECDQNIMNEVQLVTGTIVDQKVLFPIILRDSYGYTFLPNRFDTVQSNDLNNLKESIALQTPSIDSDRFVYSLDMFDLSTFNPNKVGKQIITFNYKGISKKFIINVKPKDVIDPVASFDGMSGLSKCQVEIYGDYVRYNNAYNSDFDYDKAKGIVIIRGLDLFDNIFGVTNNELWIKVDNSNSTFEHLPINNAEPIKEYTGARYSSKFTLKLYSDNRFELKDTSFNVTYTGKYSSLDNNIIYCVMYIKLFSDGTMDIY